MIDESILEPIKQAIWEARRDYKNVLKIHVTNDFYLQVKAKCGNLFLDFQKHRDYPILGYEVVEHFEPCEKEWWLEFEVKPTPRPVDEAWRSMWEYRKRQTQNLPDD
jgi:hypothetical protein